MEPSAPGAGAGPVGTRRPGTKPGWAAGQQAQRLLGHLALLCRLPEVLSRGPQPHLPLTCCWLAGTGPAPAWASGCRELGRVGGNGAVLGPEVWLRSLRPWPGPRSGRSLRSKVCVTSWPGLGPCPTGHGH